MVKHSPLLYRSGNTLFIHVKNIQWKNVFRDMETSMSVKFIQNGFSGIPCWLFFFLSLNISCVSSNNSIQDCLSQTSDSFTPEHLYSPPPQPPGTTPSTRLYIYYSLIIYQAGAGCCRKNRAAAFLFFFSSWVQVTLDKQSEAVKWCGLFLFSCRVFFPFKSGAALAAAAVMWTPWKSVRQARGGTSRVGEIMAAPLGRDTLPDLWSYGVCRDGRVFFIKWAVVVVGFFPHYYYYYYCSSEALFTQQDVRCFVTR